MGTSRIPKEIIHKIEGLEAAVKKKETRTAGDKIAVFDLDNTLLIGDIGDAVFAQLLLDKFPMPFSWCEYEGLIRAKKKREAYERVVTAMCGISVDTLIETTQRVMRSELPFLKLTDVEVPVPVPHPVMQELLKLLEFLDYKIFVISATNQYSVRFVAREYFNLPEAHVFGINPVVQKKNDPARGSYFVLGNALEQPVTVGEGKAELYHKYIGSIPPLIAAGDSETDIPMLDLTESPGLAIWVGTDERRYESIKERITHPENLCFSRR